MIEYIETLSAGLEREWSARSYDEEVFPSLAVEALERQPPHRNLSVPEIVDGLFAPIQPCRQPDSREIFGEPPILLFQGPRFYIEALFWRSGTTEIHEHSFSGAFAVLQGSSVHSHWTFNLERRVNSRMKVGRLDRLATEILKTGGVRPIRSGDRLIHQLFHLDLPSVTLVVRTYEDRDQLPQYRYFPPGLAVSEERDGLRMRRLLLLEGMVRGQIDGLRERSFDLVEKGDLETVFHTFATLTRSQADRMLLDELYAAAARRHGEIVQLFRRVCEGDRRSRRITTLRSRVTDPGGRFLLALLMLLPDRESILQTVSEEFPGTPPVATIEALLERLSGADTVGFELNDTNRAIFRALAEGLDPEMLLERLRKEFAAIDQNRDALLAHARKVAKLDLYLPLFRNSPLREELASA